MHLMFLTPSLLLHLSFWAWYTQNLKNRARITRNPGKNSKNDHFWPIFGYKLECSQLQTLHITEQI